MFDTGWKAHGTTDITSTVYEDGTWEMGLAGPGGADAKATEYGRVHWSDLDIMTLDFDDAISPTADAICFQSMEIESEYQTVDQIKPDGAGSFQGYGLAGWGGTFRITVLKDAQVEAALANVRANSGIRFQINKGAAGALLGGEFQSIMYGKISPSGITFEKEGLIGAVISGTIMAPDVSTDAWDLRWANTIDRSYPAA